MELGSQNDLKASIQHEEIEDEVHQIAVTINDGGYIEVVIMHDQFMLLKLVLNTNTIKFH